MECEKNPFLEMTQDQIKKLDEVLQSDQAKALLEEAAKKLMESTKPLRMDDSTIISSMESIGSLGDLDVLDIHTGSRSNIFADCDEDSDSITTEMFCGNFSLEELIFLEHNYAMKSAPSVQYTCEIPMQVVEDNTKASTVSQSSNRSPIRRSLRQIAKVERKQVEKNKSESEDLDNSDEDVVSRMSIESENESQNIEDNQQSNKSLVRSKLKVDSDESSGGKRADSKLKSGKASTENQPSSTRGRKPKKLLLSPDKLGANKKSPKDENNSPTKLSKLNSSPRKRVSIDVSSIAEKLSPKGKGVSVQDDKIGSPPKSARKRSTSESSDKSKSGKDQLKSPTAGPRAKRKKSLSVADGIEAQSSKKDGVAEECKTVVGEQGVKESSLPNTPTLPKAKPIKKIKRESVSLGFEPELFSQPDVMVKIKSDDSPTKKMENSPCEDTSKAIESDHVLSVKNDLSENDADVAKGVELNDHLCIDEGPSKDGANDIDSSNIMLHETTLPVLKDEDLSNLNQLELESDKHVVLAQNIDIKPQTVLTNPLIHKPLQQTNPKMVPVSPHLKNTEHSIKKETKSEPGSKISQNSSELVEDKESNRDEFEDENISNIKRELLESKKEAVLTPERKSRRVIKKKEFFEEITFQEPKRSTKNANQTPQGKKPSSEPAKKVVSEPSKKVSFEPPKKALIDPPKKSLSDLMKKTVEDNSMMESDDSEEEEEDSDWSSEDDPEKLWCICRKPHNHRFMIQCDSCEDWFHGSCVGVTRQQGQQLEKLKKEWKCPNCLKVDPAGNISNKSSSHVISRSLSNEKKDAFSKKPIKKESQGLKKIEKQFPGTSRDGGVPKRVQKAQPVSQKQLSAEIATKRKNGEIISVTNTKLQTKQVVKGREPVTRNATPIVKKARTDIVQNQKVVVTKSVPQIKTIVPQRSMPSSSNGPVKKTSARETPQKTVALSNVKKGTPVPKEKATKDNKKKNGCVSCDKAATPGSCYCSHACIEKHANECLKLIRESKNTKVMDPTSQRLVVFDRLKGTVIAGDNSPTASEIIPWLKSNPNFMIACTSSDNHGKTDGSEERNDSGSFDRRDDDDAAKETVRLNVRKTLKNILEERCKNADDIEMPEEEIRKIALHIEDELHSLFRDNSFKYRAKYRSLMFNIKDPRNQGLFRKILTGKIPPDRLVKMSTEELASVQLAKWREQENQHCLDMIKRVQLEQQKSGGTLLIKKTHKGEVEIEGDGMSVIEQDIPKPSLKVDDEVPEAEKTDLTELAKDTTHLHRSHLFDLNCKVCTGKIAPPPAEEVAPKKVRVAHSISVEFSSPTTVDPLEKSVSRVVDGKSPLSSTGDDSVDHSASSRSKKSAVPKKVTIDKSSKAKKKPSKGHSSVWKGFIFMQDVAKFVTNAYKVSGHTERLNQDIPDSIQVCGRIKPDQVWDYLSKIKQSGNKELVVIRFQAANGEESSTYNSFYHYLNSRKRYGVVNNYSKKIKDFYILPLPATSPVPIVLMPFEGPGLPPQRPHLLLGVIVRHKIKQTSGSTKKQPAKETTEVTETVEGSFTPPLEARSYTPPLPNLPSIESEKSSISLSLQSPASDSKMTTSDESSIDHSIYIPGLAGISASKRKADDAELLERSYTPPLPGTGDGKDDDKPYDPEQDISRLIMSDSKSDLSNGSNSKIPSSSPVNLEKQKKLLDELTKKFEETDRQVAALQQSIAPEADIQSSFSQISEAKPVGDAGMPSFLDLPKNLQEILNNVKQKSMEQNEVAQQGTADVDMRCLNNLPAVGNFSLCGKEDVDIRPKFNMSSSDVEDFNSSQGATPPPADDEDERSSTPRPSDPRIKLRTTYQDGSGEESAPVPLSSMSASELVERAQKELAEMEAAEKAQLSQVVPPGTTSQASSSFPSSEWTHFKEPPPPGIEPSDVQIFSPKLPDPSSLQRHTLPPSYASTSVAQEHGTPFPPPIIPPPFQAHIPPPGFAMHPPPPTDFKTCPPPTVVSPGYLPPTLPPGSLPKKDMGGRSAEESWSSWQVPGHEGDWKEPPPPHWNEEGWNHRQENYPADYYPDEGEARYYSSEHPSDYYDKPDFRSHAGWDRSSSRREGWYKRFPRDNRRDDWKGKKRSFSSRGRGNRN